MNAIYCDVMFDFPDEKPFPGNNFIIMDVTQKFDEMRPTITVDSVSTKHKPANFLAVGDGKTVVTFEVNLQFDDFQHDLFDESDVEEFVRDLVFKAGLEYDCRVSVSNQTEFSENQSA